MAEAHGLQLVAAPLERELDASISERPEMEPEMHVKVGGGDEDPWHRLMLCTKRFALKYTHGRIDLNGALTACEESIHGYYNTRDESYEGVLCRKCFLPGEIRAAERMLVEAREKAREEAELLEQERAEDAKRWEADRAERRESLRRFKTGETAPIEEPEPDTE